MVITYGTGEVPQQQTVVVGPYGSLDQQLTFVHAFSTDVTVTAVDVANPALAASFVLRIPCKPAVRLTPNCDAVADPAAPRPLSITVDGSGWDFNGGEVNATLMQRLPDLVDAVSARAFALPREDGTVSLTINLADTGGDDVGSGPLLALPAGDYFVLVEQPRFQVRVEVDFAVPCPTLAISPTCGDPGGPPDLYDILVSGSGWRPFVRAEVIFDALGSPQVFLLDVGATGQLLIRDVEEARIKPFRRPELPGGAYAVMVRQYGLDQVSREVTVPFTVPCPPPADVFIDPLCGPPQIAGDEPRNVTLRLRTKNLPSSVLTVLVDPEGRGGPPVPLQFGVAGSMDLDLTFPRRPVGSYQIVATVDALPGFSKSFTFEVPCNVREPRLRLRCDPEETNQPELSEVVLVARGWYEDAPLELTFGGTPTIVRTDAEGFYTQRTRAIDMPVGPFEAVAVQRDANGIIAERRATLVLPCGTRDPTLLISPAAAAGGTVVTINGFNFRPNATVSLQWSRGIGSTRTIDVTADVDGAFSRQVLIFHHDFSGVRELAVAGSSDPLATGVTVDFTVVPGRGSPPTIGDPSLPGLPPIVIRR